MFRKDKITSKTTMNSNDGYEGESIEKKMRRVINNKEPITDGAEIIYTERKDGVKPEYDPRTDKWEIAVDAMDKINQVKMAQRAERQKTPEQKAADKLAKDAQSGMKAEGEAPAGAN